jgi:acyl-CoA synthetase (AMP-forming)/AMP-acid ligase II
MHGASQWAVMGQSFVGNTNVLRSSFDADAVLDTIAAEHVNLLMITGDAMARPLLDTLARRDEAGTTPDLSTLFAVSSSAVLFSQTCKDELLDRLPNLVITDAIGSSESGANGITMVSKGAPMKGGPTVSAARDAVVLDDDRRPLQPGTGEIGWLARHGNIPIGYLNEPEATARTFITGADGIRYVIPGDRATLDADGTITLLGRGSVSINTGGEKVFPEEIEEQLKLLDAVVDANVVGVPDPKWGAAVTAVVELAPGTDVSDTDLVDALRRRLSSYKLPKHVVRVDTLYRSPNGKADYKWAVRTACESLGIE